MTKTATMHPLAKIAAAGLGRKAGTMTDTRHGTTFADSTSGEVWVSVVADAAADDAEGIIGSITPAPECGEVAAAAMISGRDLRRILAGVVPACDTETSRYALGGTLVEIAEGSMLNVVGTDGRRLHAGHVQPASISGQAAPIVHADHWSALEASIRALVKSVCGAAGRRLEAVIDRGTVGITVAVHKPTGGHVVAIKWQSDAADSHGRTISVTATAVALAGRFPRWRDVMVEGGQRLTIDAAAVAAAAAEFSTLHRAEEKVGKAAHKAEQAEKKSRRQPTGPDYRLDRGIDCGPAGMAGCGIVWAETIPAAPVSVRLDQRYIIDALTAAAAWGCDAPEVIGTDDRSAVTITTGDCGPRLVAVIMPMSRD
jgi:hypothetical protein